jgi:hypothetical protein
MMDKRYVMSIMDGSNLVSSGYFSALERWFKHAIKLTFFQEKSPGKVSYNTKSKNTLFHNNGGDSNYKLAVLDVHWQITYRVM